MCKFRHDATKRTDFIKIIRPLITAAMNIKNPLFKMVESTIDNDCKDNSVTFRITFFFKDKSACDHGIQHVNLYQFYSYDELSALANQVKSLLKSNTYSEFYDLHSAIKC